MIRIKNLKINEQIESCEGVNLVIGSNNVGKSTFLTEIGTIFGSLTVPESMRWVKEITVNGSQMESSFKKLLPRIFEVDNFRAVEKLDKTGFHAFSANITHGSDFWNENVYNTAKQIGDEEKEYVIHDERPHQDADYYTWRFLINKAISTETCEIRLQGQFDTTIGRLGDQQDNNILNYLFTHPDVFRLIQNNIQEVFDIKIGFDNLQQGNKSLRLLPSEKIRGATNLRETALKWQEKSPVMQEQGHGIKAYLKLIFSLLEPTNEVILIDEPETFLHPPQRRALGNLIARLAHNEHKQLFIATHDADILRGILTSGISQIKIFYLDREVNGFSYKVFNAQEINSLIANKSQLLNERILNSFFYKKTMICEAEDDRVFYENASAIYLWDSFQDTNFIGVNGKDEVIALWKQLRSLNLHVGAILDIDYLLDGTFPNRTLSDSLKQQFNGIKGQFANAKSQDSLFVKNLKADGIKYIKTSHSALLPNVEQLFENLNTNHIYVVPKGEFESWTESTPNNLQHALSVIQKTRKLHLIKFLKQVLKT